MWVAGTCWLKMAKRPGGEASAPAAKRLAMSPLDIGPACGEEDLNMKVLQVSVRRTSLISAHHIGYLLLSIYRYRTRS